MEGPLARDAAYGAVSDSVKAVTERKANLDKQQDLRLRLQGCAVSEDVNMVQNAILEVTTAGLNVADSGV